MPRGSRELVALKHTNSGCERADTSPMHSCRRIGVPTSAYASGRRQIPEFLDEAESSKADTRNPKNVRFANDVSGYYTHSLAHLSSISGDCIQLTISRWQAFGGRVVACVIVIPGYPPVPPQDWLHAPDQTTACRRMRYVELMTAASQQLGLVHSLSKYMLKSDCLPASIPVGITYICTGQHRIQSSASSQGLLPCHADEASFCVSFNHIRSPPMIERSTAGRCMLDERYSHVSPSLDIYNWN